jgi:hypothetical protein
MSIIARQSTARTFMVGPILDADGVAVTGAAVSALKISKNGGAPAALNGSATLTHRHTGHYSLSLTTSDTDTVGSAEVVIDSTTNAMPIKVITVVEEAVYDTLFAADANLLTAIADAVLTRDSSNWQATAPQKSLGTAVMKATHKIAPAGSTLQIFRSDGTTVHAEQALTTDASIEPIREIGGATAPD